MARGNLYSAYRSAGASEGRYQRGLHAQTGFEAKKASASKLGEMRIQSAQETGAAISESIGMVKDWREEKQAEHERKTFEYKAFGGDEPEPLNLWEEAFGKKAVKTAKSEWDIASEATQKGWERTKEFGGSLKTAAGEGIERRKTEMLEKKMGKFQETFATLPEGKSIGTISLPDQSPQRTAIGIPDDMYQKGSINVPKGFQGGEMWRGYQESARLGSIDIPGAKSFGSIDIPGAKSFGSIDIPESMGSKTLSMKPSRQQQDLSQIPGYDPSKVKTHGLSGAPGGKALKGDAFEAKFGKIGDDPKIKSYSKGAGGIDYKSTATWGQMEEGDRSKFLSQYPGGGQSELFEFINKQGFSE